MKIEVGKYYRTRDGHRVKVTISDCSDTYPFCGVYDCGTPFWYYGVYDCGTPFWYYRDGRVNIDDSGRDLIAEWIDEPAKDENPEPTLSGETIDHIAIDSLKWHFKDKDMEPLQYEAFRVVLRYYGVTV
jgi:hypothetical protein